MKKILLAAAGAALVLGSVATSDAEARPGYRNGHARGHYVHRRGGNRAAGAAVAAGVAGAVIGGAIAADAARRDRYYDRPAYGYYGPGYGY
jgi:opacity protein-like surface antigen